MDTMTIVWIVLVLVILVLFFKFVKRLFNVALSAAGIVVVVWLIVIGLRYADENNLRNNLIVSNNLFLLQDSDDLITGFASDGTQIDPLQLPDFTDSTSDIYDEYYKIIIVHKESLPEEIGMAIDTEDSEQQLTTFKDYITTQITGSDDPVDTLIEEEKNGYVEVHKNTMAFKHGIREVFDL